MTKNRFKTVNINCSRERLWSKRETEPPANEYIANRECFAGKAINVLKWIYTRSPLHYIGNPLIFSFSSSIIESRNVKAGFKSNLSTTKTLLRWWGGVGSFTASYTLMQSLSVNNKQTIPVDLSDTLAVLTNVIKLIFVSTYLVHNISFTKVTGY